MTKITIIGLLMLITQFSNAQNSCATALPISAGLHNVTSVDGTNIVTTCSSPAMAEWYAYTPTSNYTVTITSDLAQNICKDTDFEVYTGNCGALVCYSGDDDGGNIACNSGNTNSYLSVASFNVTAGTTYYIAWTNRWSALGFEFQLTETAVQPNPCATAIPVTAGITTVAAIDGLNRNTTCSTASLAKWYAYTPTQNYIVTVSSDLAQNICKDTFFGVYTGSCLGTLTCLTSDDNSGVIACNSGNTNSNLSVKTFQVIAGTTYYIAWDNRWSAAGFDFQISEALNPCTNATTIAAGTHTVGALTGNNITTTCSTTALSKWYKYIPTAEYNVTITSDLIQNICKDTNFSVYTGICTGTLTCVLSDDNSGIIACNSGNTNSFLSKNTFQVTAGTTYYIAWDNKWSTAGFDFELIESAIIRPINYTTQAIATINSTYNICAVDMNGDRKDDIVGVSANNLRVHFQGAGGTFSFSDFPIAGTNLMPTWSLAAGDYNRDGFNDLILGNGQGATIWKSNNGIDYSAISQGQYIFCQRTNFADLNNDGHLDLFSCHDVAPNCYYLNDSSSNLTFYQTTMTGAFRIGTLSSGGNYATLFTDFDNDGDSDVFISKCSGPACEIHRNDGNGVYTDISALAAINVTPIQSWSSAIADFDNDGDMDILIGSNGAVANKLFRNNLDTSNAVEEAFSDITIGSGWDIMSSNSQDYIAYDFDNDGLVDVMGGNVVNGKQKIMFNQGNNVFSMVEYSTLSIGAVADLNNDGFLDIQNGNSIRLAVPNGNNWLKVTLQGVQSNANGIGARVTIYGAFGKKIRDIRSGEGFRFMSSLNAHFGLGTATAITSMTIQWPSGTVDTINNPTINSIINIVEGQTLGTEDFDINSFAIYPNPTNNLVNIELLNQNIISITITDILGKIIKTIDNIGTSKTTIDVSSFAKGLYLTTIKTEQGKQFSKKLVVN